MQHPQAEPSASAPSQGEGGVLRLQRIVRRAVQNQQALAFRCKPFATSRDGLVSGNQSGLPELADQETRKDELLPTGSLVLVRYQ